MAWTDDRVEQLKKLWAEGLSASQIAGKMGGVTRNAVIGKVHRLGLSGRATPASPSRGRTNTSTTPSPRPAVERTARPTTLKSPEVKPLITAPEVSRPVVLDSGDLTTVATLNRNMCKWPIGDPAKEDFHFCGQPSSSGKPYCEYHAHVAFQPAQRRSDRRPEPARIANANAKKQRAAG